MNQQQQQQQKQQKPKDTRASHEITMVRTMPPATSVAMTQTPKNNDTSSPFPVYRANSQNLYMPFKTRVNVIPSFAPKNQSLRNMHRGTTTLGLKLEPSLPSKVSGTQKNRFDTSVFSGPHYQPDKYTIKTSTNLGEGCVLSEKSSSIDHASDSKYLIPRLDDHFTSALKDGSYFESYSSYNPEDPENFRHAFSKGHGVSRLTSTPSRPNGMNQTFTTLRDVTQFRPYQTQQDRYVIETKTINTKLGELKKQVPMSPSSQSTPTSTPPLPLPSHHYFQSSKSSPNADLQDERVNQILEAANLLDFSGQITFTTTYEETTSTTTTTADMARITYLGEKID
ncbi:hypothetical protein [Parasitella parasitica]|uniref:Uncharacterized protein n=1 Tax=Parasitella parasitica TaxID=35722 RepID=A0A0B7NED3_9FUNG|nr:hypothetical protein [Parasitella parasitica]